MTAVRKTLVELRTERDYLEWENSRTTSAARIEKNARRLVTVRALIEEIEHATTEAR
jgi:hypothetical protein